MKGKITWKKNTGKYASGESAFCGLIRIGSYFWNISSSTPRWNMDFFLRGILEAKGKETESECKQAIEEAFEKFLSKLEIIK